MDEFCCEFLARAGLPGDEHGAVSHCNLSDVSADFLHRFAVTDQTLIELVHVSDCLAHSLGIGADVGELARHVDERAVSRLGLTEQRLESVVTGSIAKIRSSLESEV